MVTRTLTVDQVVAELAAELALAGQVTKMTVGVQVGDREPLRVGVRVDPDLIDANFRASKLVVQSLLWMTRALRENRIRESNDPQGGPENEA